MRRVETNVMVHTDAGAPAATVRTTQSHCEIHGGARAFVGRTRWRPVRPAVRSRPYSQRGFTLLEMLVVLMIAGMLVAMVALAPSRNRRTDLAEEAQRLATMLETADDEAQIRSASIAWQPGEGGYRFYQRNEDGKWQPLADDLLKPRRWGDAVTAVSIRYTGSGETTSRIVFGDESIDVPVTVTLGSGSVQLQIMGTGIGNFAVRRP